MAKLHRSPSYPYLALQDAVAVAEKLYKKEKRQPAPVEVIAQHAGYETIKSSSALRTIASLNHYGLVVETGAGGDRKMRLSDVALDILLAESPGSPARKKALRSAALLPTVHQAILREFPEHVPSDGTLRNYLIRDLDFNDDSVDNFIGKFKKTVDFAGLYVKNGDSEEIAPQDDLPGITAGDLVQWTRNGVEQFSTPKQVAEVSFERDEWIARLEGEDEWIEMSELSVFEPPPKESGAKPMRAAPPPPPPRHDGPFISFPLAPDNTLEIRLTSRVSKRDFERLKMLIDLSEDSLVEPDSPST